MGGRLRPDPTPLGASILAPLVLNISGYIRFSSTQKCPLLLNFFRHHWRLASVGKKSWLRPANGLICNFFVYHMQNDCRKNLQKLGSHNRSHGMVTVSPKNRGYGTVSRHSPTQHYATILYATLHWSKLFTDTHSRYVRVRR